MTKLPRKPSKWGRLGSEWLTKGSSASENTGNYFYPFKQSPDLELQLLIAVRFGTFFLGFFRIYLTNASRVPAAMSEVDFLFMISFFHVRKCKPSMVTRVSPGFCGSKGKIQYLIPGSLRLVLPLPPSHCLHFSLKYVIPMPRSIGADDFSQNESVG